MATEFRIEPDPEQLAEMNRRLEYWGANTNAVMRVAINNTARRVRTSTVLPGGGAKQRIIARYNIKDAAARLGTTPSAYVDERLKVWTANNNSLIGKIYGKKRGMLLSPFRQGLTGLHTGARPNPPEANVLLSSGTKLVKKVPQTVSKPFYIQSTTTGQILIVGRKSDETLKVARTISVSQIFNFLRRDMLPIAKEEFTRQQVAAARYMLQKLQVPMEDPEGP